MQVAKRLLVVLAVIASSLLVIQHFPTAYRTGADEGTYYRQAKLLLDNGWSGISLDMTRYLGDKALHLFPPPVRFLSLVTNAWALSVNDSYRSLSAMSLLWFVLLIGVTWHYVTRLWDEDVALVTCLLLACSPIALALAKRALIDSLSYLLAAFALFSFLELLRRQTRTSLAVFAGSLVLLQLARETGFLYYPFFLAVLLVESWRGRLRFTPAAVIATFVAVASAAGLILAMVYGPQNYIAVFHAIQAMFRTNDAYAVLYSSGPWYRYIVDLMLLSPLTILLALLYSGSLIFGDRHDAGSLTVLLFVVYVIAMFDNFYKNIRYVIVLDLAVRLLVAVALTTYARARGAGGRHRTMIAVALVVIMLVLDYRTFLRFFVTHDIYDPVSSNLLEIERFIPPSP